MSTTPTPIAGFSRSDGNNVMVCPSACRDYYYGEETEFCVECGRRLIWVRHSNHPKHIVHMKDGTAKTLTFVSRGSRAFTKQESTNV